MQVVNHLLRDDSGTLLGPGNSPNHGSVLSQPTLLVMHFTAGRSFESSVSWLSDPAAKASAHLVIGRDGSLGRSLAGGGSVIGGCLLRGFGGDLAARGLEGGDGGGALDGGGLLGRLVGRAGAAGLVAGEREARAHHEGEEERAEQRTFFHGFEPWLGRLGTASGQRDRVTFGP